MRSIVPLTLTFLVLAGGLAGGARAESTDSIAQVDERWLARNEAQGFEARFSGAGVALRATESAEADWRFDLALLRIGRVGETMAPVEIDGLTGSAGRLEIRRSGVVEWYVNHRTGLEQGFDIPRRIAGPQDRPLAIDLAVDTELHGVFSDDGQAVEYFDADGRLALRYAKLEVRDARDERLEARIEPLAGGGVRGLRLVVDDREATYPIVVDPLMTTESWIVYGTTGSTFFGNSFAGVGDVDGDGYGDVVVGDWSYDNGETNEGLAELYLGSPSGLQGSPAWSFEPDEANAHLGLSVAGAGDVNGDGYPDIAVACRGCDTPLGNTGKVLVFYGGPGGPSSVPDVELSGDIVNGVFGQRVVGAGDFNADGYADLAVSAPNFDFNRGRVYIYTGSPGGLTLAATHDGPIGNTDYYGGELAGGGDFDGDGFDDVVVGALGTEQMGLPNVGAAYVIYGAASGSGGSVALPLPAVLAEETYIGDEVVFVGDLDGDGDSEIAVGEVLRHGEYGGIAIHDDSGARYEVPGNIAPFSDYGIGQLFGDHMAPVGDMDDDGIPDLAVAAASADVAWILSGRYLLLSLGAVRWTRPAPLDDDNFGTELAAADVNGDGRFDLIVGSTLDDDPNQVGSWEGSVRVYHGGPPIGLPQAWYQTFQWGGPELHFAFAENAGDVNGDGFHDVIHGQPFYDGAESPGGRASVYYGGWTGIPPTPDWIANSTASHERYGIVDGAGDVNGDGYDDVLIGDPWFDGSGLDSGLVELYYGSPSGLGGSADWSVEWGFADAWWGGRPRGLGDINGDGFADLAVSSPYFDGVAGADAGRVQVYLGSPSGPASTPDWTYESGQANDTLGWDIDAAGDVNADGYSDMVVGAVGYGSGRGAVHLFYGGPAGFGSSPDWTFAADGTNTLLGYSVAGLGDIDGDGYADIGTSSPYFSGMEGRAWLFLGGPAGPGTDPDFTMSHEVSSRDDQYWGGVIGGIGDVNADGLSDFAVGCASCDSFGAGAPYVDRDGGVFVYHGSPTGPSPTADWRDYGDVADWIGWTVAGADVNGDGFSDLLIGTETEGFQLVRSQDNADHPVRRLPRLRRSDDSAPIPHLGRSDASDAVTLTMEPPILHGPGAVALEVEVKPLGAPFDGTNTHVGPWRENGDPPMPEAIAGLAETTVYHWRARYRFDPVARPWASFTPWITNARNGWNEADFRTDGLITAGAVPDGNQVAGAPLTLGFDGQGNIQLTWSASCGVEDGDYAVYMGTLGDFTSHVPVACSTSGLTSGAYPPDPIDVFYLVVPVNTTFMREGSYGTDSFGTPRAVSASACFPAATTATCDP